MILLTDPVEIAVSFLIRIYDVLNLYPTIYFFISAIRRTNFKNIFNILLLLRAIVQRRQCRINVLFKFKYPRGMLYYQRGLF